METNIKKRAWKCEILKNKPEDMNSNFQVIFPPVRPKELLRKEKGWLTDVGHSLWWYMNCAQHAAHDPKFQNMGLFKHPQWPWKIKSPIVFFDKIWYQYKETNFYTNYDNHFMVYPSISNEEIDNQFAHYNYILNCNPKRFIWLFTSKSVTQCTTQQEQSETA